jgi:hypothetical protein
VQAPAFVRISFWSAKRLAILLGFALTAIGTLGPQFYVSSVEDRSGETGQFAKSLTARIDTLRAAQSQYLLFEQMGVLVYALNASGLAAAGSSQHDTLSNLYQLALLDRSTSMRQMIGELAMARAHLSRDFGQIRRANRHRTEGRVARFLSGGRRFRDADHAAGGRPDGAPAGRLALRRAYKKRPRLTRRKA